jgi:hypothetical protein
MKSSCLFSTLCLLFLSLLTTAAGQPAFQSATFFADANCLDVTNPVTYGATTSYFYWGNITIANAQTATTNIAGPPCVNAPIAGVASGLYVCSQTRASNNQSQYSVQVWEWLNNANCPGGSSGLSTANQTFTFQPLAGATPQTCVQGRISIAGVASPSVVYGKFTCGGSNSASSTSSPSVVAMLFVAITIAVFSS